jgi:hypothetical protein
VAPLNRRFLARAFGAGGDFVFARFVFALAFANLLLDFFFHQVNRGVQIAFAIFGEQVRAAHAEAHGAAELPLGDPHVVVLKSDARVDDARVQAIQFIELGEHVLLNGIRQRYVVRGEDQLHTDNMQSGLLIFNRQIYPGIGAEKKFKADGGGEIRNGDAAWNAEFISGRG